MLAAVFPPPKSPSMPAWMELGARLGHWTIYALLVLVPLTAILGALLEGHPLTVLVLGNIEPWASQSWQLGLVLAPHVRVVRPRRIVACLRRTARPYIGSNVS